MSEPFYLMQCYHLCLAGNYTQSSAKESWMWPSPLSSPWLLIPSPVRLPSPHHPPSPQTTAAPHPNYEHLIKSALSSSCRRFQPCPRTVRLLLRSHPALLLMWSQVSLQLAAERCLSWNGPSGRSRVGWLTLKVEGKKADNSPLIMTTWMCEDGNWRCVSWEDDDGKVSRRSV